MPYANSNHFLKALLARKKPMLAVLIDPDKFNPELIRLANSSSVSCFLVGGSKLNGSSVHKTILRMKQLTSLPIIIFPGDETQLSSQADILFLPSLLSGRNPDYLIEKHIAMAPKIRQMKLKTLPMAYLLINGRAISATQKVTDTKPLNPKRVSYIVNTCQAAAYLGFQLLYLEAGSGAKAEVPARLIKAVKAHVTLPLIVGGGISTAGQIKKLIHAGADVIVVGNALEKNVHLITTLSACFN